MIRGLPPIEREALTFEAAVDDVERLALEVLALVDVGELLIDPAGVTFTAQRLVRLARGLRIAAGPLLSGEAAR